MVFVTVVALNALIAILGDSFEQAQDMRVASRTKQRAELIVEYYDVMRPSKRNEVEQSTRWTHQLTPEAMLGRFGEGDAWQGRLFVIRDWINQKTDALDQKIDEKVDELDEKVDALDKKVDSLDKKVHALGSKMDQKFDALGQKIGEVLNILKPA